MARRNSTTIDEDELCCPICFEDYVLSDRKRHPKLLLCLHTFCYSCIVNLKRYNNGILQCSICRAEHDIDSVNELLDNDAIHYHLRKKQEQEDKRYAYRVSQRNDDTDASESEDDDRLFNEIVTASSDEDSELVLEFPSELAFLYENILPEFVRITQLIDGQQRLQEQEQQQQQQQQEQQQQQQQEQQRQQQQQEQQRQQQQQEQQRQQQQQQQQRQQQQQQQQRQQQQQQQQRQQQQQQQQQRQQQQQQQQRQQQQQQRQQQQRQQQQKSERSRKVFVGGLSDLSQSELFHYFRRYGTIDKIDLRHRFAFILFATSETVDRVLGTHDINDVRVIVQRYHHRGYKIYVGGIQNLSLDEVKAYFQNFGVLKHIQLPMVRQDFCFITYDEEGEMFAALRTPYPEVRGSKLRVKRFNPTLWNG